MCGIAGIRGELDNRQIVLRKMLNSMFLRGPDSQGEYFEGKMALGQCRLKVIDLTAQGNQPMSNESNNIWIIHNGEIYNFRELRQQLEDLGHRFKSQTDTEVILHGYEEWGKDCLKELRGMFAFCIWDKNKEELFLAKDRLGIKPLYYYLRDGIFIFASCVRAILVSGLIPHQLSYQGLLTYLDYGGIKEPWTIIEGVYSLAPAHYITLKEKEFKIVNYWNLFDISESSSFSRIEEITERINPLLKESVKLHLISDVPLGIFLSGGIDSGSLLSLTQGLIPKIKSISLVFKEKTLNEASYSRLLAKKYHTEHQEVLIQEDYLLKNLSSATLAMDEPTFNGINTYFISKVAKEAGLVVALSGLGGDEVFGGYSSFRRIAKLIWFCKFWDRVPKLSKKICTEIFKRIIPSVSQGDKIMELLKNGSTLRHPYFWIRLLFTEEQKKHLLKTYSSFAREQTDGFEDSDIINLVSYLEMSNYMKDILLRDTDFMSMAHSLEVRVPLLDHKLIEFMFSIPGKFKIDRYLYKPLLVKSLDDPLPKTIIRRKKMGFVFPFDFWLRQNLKTEIEHTLKEKNNVLDEFFNQEAVLEIWQGFLKGQIYWQRPWAIYVLKKWVKAYLQ